MKREPCRKPAETKKRSTVALAQEAVRKGEESGNSRRCAKCVSTCDADAILLKVEQVGGYRLPHGARELLFPQLENGNG